MRFEQIFFLIGIGITDTGLAISFWCFSWSLGISTVLLFGKE
jgi:hypothetical protein